MTPVDVGRCDFLLSMRQPVLMLGSCFADNIGRMLVDYGFSAMVNPLGTTYNPASIASSLRRIADGSPFSEDECVRIGAGDGRVCSFFHHTRHARSCVADFLVDANSVLAEANAFWQSAEVLVVTLGTAWVFRHVETGHVVSNCLKLPASQFVRERLTVEQCVAYLEDVARIADGRKVLFTVSPIRHMADGAHGNQLSKSTLLLSVDEILARVGDAGDYFPAYEILLDELRDYRFYADDMAHPSSAAERYVFDRFMDFILPDDERTSLAEGVRRAKAQAHIVR